MKGSALTTRLKQYPLAVTCGILILISLVVFFLRKDVTTNLSLKESELISRTRTIEQNIKNAKNLEEDTEKLEAIVEEMDSRLFDRSERAVNRNFFYKIEEKADVVISSLSLLPDPEPVYSKGGPRPLDLHTTLVYNLSLGGSFTNVLRFLHELDRAEPLIRVANFQISRGDKKQSANYVEARLRVLVMAENN